MIEDKKTASMISAFYFLIAVRIILDFLGFFKPRPMWDVLYIILFFGAGAMFIIGDQPDIPSSRYGWLLIAIGVIWGLLLYIKQVKGVAKPKSDTVPKESKGSE